MQPEKAKLKERKIQMFVRIRPLESEKEGGHSGTATQKQLSHYENNPAKLKVSGIMGGRETQTFTFPEQVLMPELT